MRPIPLLLSLLLACTCANAADWTMQPGSTLGFRATYQDEAFEGSFGKFTPQIRFDPAHLADSRFDVRISLASANTHNEERDEMLRGNQFFNAGKLAEARFLATKFRALGGNRYAADGVLAMKGISKPVSLLFTWSPGARAVLAGEASLKRLEFGVGTGDWTDTDVLPDEVKVQTRLVLAPAAANSAANRPAAAKPAAAKPAAAKP